MLESQHHLDDPGHAGRRLGVTEVRLDRPQPQRAVFRAFLPVGLQQGLRLDRVSQRGARPVRLHDVHLGGAQPRRRQRRVDHPLLRRPVRRGQPVGSPVLIDGAAADHRQHVMPVPARVGQALHHHYARALGPPRPVRRGGERSASPVGRHSPLPGEPHEHGRGGDHRDAARERHRALAGPQGLAGQVQRHQRGGARRVHRHRVPLQAQGEGHPAGQHAGRVARHQVALGGPAEQVHPVPRGERAHEHPGLAAAQRRRADARPLDRLPADLQQQPLLRVHGQRLPRADPEEPRVELRHVIDESAMPRVRGPRMIRIRVIQRFEVPAAIGGQSGDRVCPLRDQLPQFLRAPHPARVPAAHPHDRDGLGDPFLHLAKTPPSQAQISGYQLEVIAELILIYHLKPPFTDWLRRVVTLSK